MQAALHLLDTYGNTKVISNPHLAALDNQKATIKVGNRIPINQQTLVGGTTNAVTTTAQYIDTGVLVQVTPHINAGGLVTLEVDAEVSTPGTSAANEAPPINTRSVQTLLAVPTGQTMVMGGLITENSLNNSTGLCAARWSAWTRCFLERKLLQKAVRRSKPSPNGDVINVAGMQH